MWSRFVNRRTYSCVCRNVYCMATSSAQTGHHPPVTMKNVKINVDAQDTSRHTTRDSQRLDLYVTRNEEHIEGYERVKSIRTWGLFIHERVDFVLYSVLFGHSRNSGMNGRDVMKVETFGDGMRSSFEDQSDEIILRLACRMSRSTFYKGFTRVTFWANCRRT